MDAGTGSRVFEVTTLREYEEAARRTMPRMNERDSLSMLCLGLAGESGELIERIKKYLYHGHTMDATELRKELGDILWYWVNLCHELGLDPTHVATTNIAKLRQRYPNGFSEEASRNRNG